MDIPILFPGDYVAPPPVPVEFYVTKKSKQKMAMDYYEHFKQLLCQVKADNLPVPKAPTSKKEAREYQKKDHLVVLAESEEVTNQILDRAVGELLRAHGHALQELHITDHQIYNKYPVFLRARIDIGESDASMDSALAVLRALLMIVDRVVRLRVSDANRAKSEKNRKKNPSQKAKEAEERDEQEEMDKLRRKANEEREKLRKMTPEQQRKYEEKKRQQEL